MKSTIKTEVRDREEFNQSTDNNETKREIIQQLKEN